MKADGTVAAWGAGTADTGTRPQFGQATVPEGLTNVVSVAAGGYHTLALSADGTVAAWGGTTSGASPHYGQSLIPSGLSNVVSITAGLYHSLAMSADGTVAAWGAGTSDSGVLPDFGQCLMFDLITLLPGNEVRIVLRGLPGDYAVETSSDLVTWRPWTNISLGTAAVELADGPVTNQARRFVRARPGL